MWKYDRVVEQRRWWQLHDCLHWSSSQVSVCSKISDCLVLARMAISWIAVGYYQPMNTKGAGPVQSSRRGPLLRQSFDRPHCGNLETASDLHVLARLCRLYCFRSTATSLFTTHWSIHAKQQRASNDMHVPHGMSNWASMIGQNDTHNSWREWTKQKYVIVQVVGKTTQLLLDEVTFVLLKLMV